MTWMAIIGAVYAAIWRKRRPVSHDRWVRL